MFKKLISSEKAILFLIGGFSILVLILIIVISISEQKGSAKAAVITYSSIDKDKPKAQTSATFSDLGVMKVNEEKTAYFTLQNTGSKSLQLFDISSSCGCTLGQVEIENQKSPEFGMHSKTTWIGNIEPGKTAKISVIYRPYIMPVKGEVEREVYVTTNDPDNKFLTFSVKAVVE